MFNKGDRVRLNEYGLNFLFSSLGSNRYRDMAVGKTFIVLGHSRDKKCTRVMIEGGSSNSSLTYSNTFLEAAEEAKLKKDQIMLVYQDPVTKTKPEGQAKLLRLIERSGDLENWLVQFLDDDFDNPVHRLIKTN